MALPLKELRKLLTKAARKAGAGKKAAKSLAEATMDAEACGQAAVGLSHFFDYLDSLQAGRIDGQAKPKLTKIRPALFHCDAKGGMAHPGVDKALPKLAKAAKKHGIAAFLQNNAYTCGSLGFHAVRLAEKGLIGLAFTNGPALIAGGGAVKPVYCTNPMAFAAPVKDQAPLLIDQSSSATAFVNVRAAANEGLAIPPGWAVDKDGKPTTDAKAAMEGALLAFGGARGGNVALMVEVMAGGLASANWSLDAPSILEGNLNTGSGLTLIAIDPDAVDKDFSKRLATQLNRLSDDYGVHIPGRAKAEARARADVDGVALDLDLEKRLREAAGEKPAAPIVKPARNQKDLKP